MTAFLCYHLTWVTLEEHSGVSRGGEQQPLPRPTQTKSGLLLQEHAGCVRDGVWVWWLGKPHDCASLRIFLVLLAHRERLALNPGGMQVCCCLCASASLAQQAGLRQGRRKVWKEALWGFFVACWFGWLRCLVWFKDTTAANRLFKTGSSSAASLQVGTSSPRCQLWGWLEITPSLLSMPVHKEWS